MWIWWSSVNNFWWYQYKSTWVKQLYILSVNTDLYLFILLRRFWKYKKIMYIGVLCTSSGNAHAIRKHLSTSKSPWEFEAGSYAGSFVERGIQNQPWWSPPNFHFGSVLKPLAPFALCNTVWLTIFLPQRSSSPQYFSVTPMNFGDP